MDDEWEDDAIELLGAMGALDDDEDPILGDLDDYVDELGARRRFGGRSRRRGRRRSLRSRLKRMLVPKTPGVPTPGGREQPLGFTTVQFTNTSALTLQLTCRPNRPIKGRRLIIDLVRSVAGSGGLLTVNRFDVGGKNQLLSQDPVTINAFAHDATLTLLALDPITPGVPGILEITASAQPGVGETVDVAATLYCLSIG